ncbi:hypothetical protein ACVGXX_06315, partial [Enterobacter intestinihominis]
VDVWAGGVFFELLKRVAAQNVGVLMFSSDLDDFPGLADRVVVMAEGCLLFKNDAADDLTIL